MYTSTALAVLGLTALAQAHVKMTFPIPFGDATLTNAPLNMTGADFPCKQRPGVYDTTGIPGGTNNMPLGSSHELSFMGSAVHGGGSCQLSITYDTAPTVNSVWKVIHSIEGGCPERNIAGNAPGGANTIDPSTYNFTIPTSLPTGKAVLAWTWYNKIGNREIYMNCAPVSLTAGASKRGEDQDLVGRNESQLMQRDLAAYNALPDMLVINLPPLVEGGCVDTEDYDLKFPNPGDSVEQNSPKFATGTVSNYQGTACSTAPGIAAVAGAAAVTPVAGTSVAASSVAPQVTSSATPTVTGGVFLGSLSSVASSATSIPVASSAASVAPIVSSVASVAPVASSPVASVVASSASPSSTGTASTGTTGTGSAIAAGTACTPEGEWNCIGGSSFQRCASGAWSVVMELAAGTTCADGQSSAMSVSAIVASKEKRMVERRRGRFSGAHIRRHLQS